MGILLDQYSFRTNQTHINLQCEGLCTVRSNKDRCIAQQCLHIFKSILTGITPSKWTRKTEKRYQWINNSRKVLTKMLIITHHSQESMQFLLCSRNGKFCNRGHFRFHGPYLSMSHFSSFHRYVIVACPNYLCSLPCEVMENSQVYSQCLPCDNLCKIWQIHQFW